MTHAGPMADSEGEFGRYLPCAGHCPQCRAEALQVRTWESRCGGWEDWQFRCAACGHSWWVDGIDS